MLRFFLSRSMPLSLSLSCLPLSNFARYRSIYLSIYPSIYLCFLSLSLFSSLSFFNRVPAASDWPIEVPPSLSSFSLSLSSSPIDLPISPLAPPAHVRNLLILKLSVARKLQTSLFFLPFQALLHSTSLFHVFFTLFSKFFRGGFLKCQFSIYLY